MIFQDTIIVPAEQCLYITEKQGKKISMNKFIEYMKLHEISLLQDAEKLTKQADKAKNPETKYPKYKKATMRYAGAHKARGKIFKKEFMGEDGGGAGGAGGAGAVAAAGPTNTASGGAIASIGQPPGSKFGEPGVDLRKKKKSDPRMFSHFRRKAPKA